MGNWRARVCSHGALSVCKLVGALTLEATAAIALPTHVGIAVAEVVLTCLRMSEIRVIVLIIDAVRVIPWS